jgi:accessory colonization factor AcfC
MRNNKKALELVEKGLSSKTVSKLTESQINVLHLKLLGEATVNVSSKNPNAAQIAKDMTSKGINITMTEKELEEEEEVTVDPNKETETQDAHQVGPSSDDGPT